MAGRENQPPNRGGFGRPRGRRRRGDHEKPKEEQEWIPVTNLGRLVASRQITSLEEIFFHSWPIKEEKIVDKLFERSSIDVKNEVLTVQSVQKQTRAG